VSNKVARYKGVQLQYSLKYQLIQKILEGQFYQHNMELEKAISDAMEKYARNARRLTAAYRKTRKK
jgi:hypothetical protein